MYQILDNSLESYVVVKFEGKITSKDYDKLLPFFEDTIVRNGSLKILCDFSEMLGVEISVVWRDFKFGIIHFRDWSRVAIVGGPRWMKACAKPFVLIMPFDCKFFNKDRLKQAEVWVSCLK